MFLHVWGYILNYNWSNFYLSLINIFFGSMIRGIQRCFYVKMTDIQRSVWLTAAILDSIYSYVHDAIDISCNKFILWGLNVLVIRMKKDESLTFIISIHFQDYLWPLAGYFSNNKF